LPQAHITQACNIPTNMLYLPKKITLTLVAQLQKEKTAKKSQDHKHFNKQKLGLQNKPICVVVTNETKSKR